MSISDTWDSAYETTPAGSDSPTLGDNKIRQNRQAVRQRGERGHIWGVSETNAKHGWHREGSGRVFVAATAPTVYDDVDGTSIGSDADIDQGRLFFDSTQAYLPQVYDGGWEGFLREIARVSIQGTLSAGTNVLPAIVFPRACTIIKVTARVGTAPTGASLIIDLNKTGTSSIFSGVTRITIAAGAYSDNVTSFHATNKVLTADGYLTLDIDQIGSTIGGADFSLTIEVILG